MQILINFLSNSLKFSKRDSKIVLNLEMIETHSPANSDLSLNVSRNISYNQSIQEVNIEQVEPREFDNEMNEELTYIHFKLSIQDFGCGIPAEKLDSLFMNFGNL